MRYANTMGELLGITGAIGSGKTTFADCLMKIEPSHAFYDTSLLVAEVADVFNKALKAELAYDTANKPLDIANQVLIWLPDAISEILHQDVVWNQLAITTHHALARPEHYDKLLVYLKQTEKKPKLLDKPITPRNKSDYRALLQWLGNYLVVKVSKTIWYDELMRRATLRDQDKNMVLIAGVRYPSDAEVVRTHGGIVIDIERPGAQSPATDATESERQNIKPDIIVINNGSLANLDHVAETVWRDIGAGIRYATYRAT
jgi:hypothetical protein